MGRKAQFREAWEMNAQMNARLLDAIGEEGLAATYAPRARTVRRVWVHLHNMRLHWLGALAEGVPQDIIRLKSREAHDIATLRAALAQSDAAIATWLGTIAKKKKVKVFGHSPTALLGYILAHEAHHRGQMIVALRLAGHPLPRQAILEIWNY